MRGKLLSIGECMVELSQAGDNLLCQGFAGDTFNTAWYARRCLPVQWTIDYFTSVGNDPLSHQFVAFANNAGIGTNHIVRLDGRTLGLYLIRLRHGERSFCYWRDNSAARLLASDQDRLHQAIDSTDIIYFSGITLAIVGVVGAETLISCLRRARAIGKLIAFDPNIRPRLWPDNETMQRVLMNGAAVASMVLPSFDDEQSCFGDVSPAATIERYRGIGVNAVIVKNGAGKVHVFDRGEAANIPVRRVEHVVDTTSAGDSFNGAFLAHYCLCKSAPAAASFGAAIAGDVIGTHGALVSIDKARQKLTAQFPR